MHSLSDVRSQTSRLKQIRLNTQFPWVHVFWETNHHVLNWTVWELTDYIDINRTFFSKIRLLKTNILLQTDEKGGTENEKKGEEERLFLWERTGGKSTAGKKNLKGYGWEKVEMNEWQGVTCGSSPHVHMYSNSLLISCDVWCFVLCPNVSFACDHWIMLPESPKALKDLVVMNWLCDYLGSGLRALDLGGHWDSCVNEASE